MSFNKKKVKLNNSTIIWEGREGEGKGRERKRI